jgi:hypothetical protein
MHLAKPGVADILSQNEKDFLDQNGYLKLGRILSAGQLSSIRNKIQELLQKEGENTGNELIHSTVHKNPILWHS